MYDGLEKLEEEEMKKQTPEDDVFPSRIPSKEDGDIYKMRHERWTLRRSSKSESCLHISESNEGRRELRSSYSSDDEKEIFQNDEAEGSQENEYFSSVQQPKSVVMPQLSTREAKLRSFMVGHISGKALLGLTELKRYFPDRILKIYILSWNMNGQPPLRRLDEIVYPSFVEAVPDLLVIGSQESYPARRIWEVDLQEAIGPSHVLFHSTALGTLHLALFIRRDLIWFCSEPETSSFSIRQPTTIKTKGGICIMLYFFGTSLLFINSHLSAHHDNVQDRISDYKRICRGLDFPKILPIKSHRYTSDITSMFDYVFWFGDLNFRISQPRDAVLEQVSTNGQPRFSQAILKHDQLLSLITEGSAFKGFSEAPIHFPPTYKYDPGTGNWDSSDKQRTPAYTDRILYRCKTSRTVKSLAYDSLTYVKTSDHKPVWGLFTVTIRPGSEANIPLSAGLFQRDIYLAALERRATALEIKKRKTMPSKSKSLVCSIQ